MMTSTGKRFLWVLLGLTLTLALYCSAATAESGTWGDLSWELDDEGILTIGGEGAMYGFTGSSTDAWRAYLNDIRSIIIEEGVTSIGAYAFSHCENLIDITLAESVTRISEKAFLYCNSMTSISPLDNVTSFYTVGYGTAFDNCPAVRYAHYGSAGAKAISREGFSFRNPGDLFNCRYVFEGGYQPAGLEITRADADITSVVIPDIVTGIRTDAFTDCSSLTSINIPENVTTIGRSAFLNSTVVYVVSLDSNAAKTVSLSGHSFRIPGDQYDLRYSISNNEVTGLTLTNVDKDLEAFVFPDGVTNIGPGAFQNCSALTSISIPNSVTSIKSYTFSGCSNLTDISIPNSVTSIESYAFSGCSNLTDISIPNTVTSIGEYAFQNCSSLTNINIPDGISSIDHYTFCGCAGLTGINIPDSVTSIGLSAFDGCTNLASISLPDGITSVSSYVFNNCPAVKYCSFGSDTAKALGKAGCSFRVSGEPFEFIYRYSGNEIIGLYLNVIDQNITSAIIPYGVTHIGPFQGLIHLESVTIPSSVTIIPDNTFKGCTSLTDITIPDSITSIGAGAFRNCASLTSVSMTSSITSIGTSAFSNCKSLSSLVIPDSVTTMGNSVFWYCTSLESVTLPAGINSIPNQTFGYCSSLTSVTIPEGISIIGQEAFTDCSALTTITIPNGVVSISAEAFNGCNSLTSIVIPEGISSIGSYAFSGCSSLTSITLPNTLESIDYGAFIACSNLASITIPSGISSIESSVFENCNNLASVTLPSSIISIGPEAFYGCKNLQIIGQLDNVTTIVSNSFSNHDAIYYASLTSAGAKALSKAGFSFRVPGDKYSMKYMYDAENIIGLKITSVDTDITSVTIHEGVSCIGDSAFRGCTSLSSISFPEGLQSIEKSAFAGCTSLSDISFPTTLTSIGTAAFSGCNNLYSVILPDHITGFAGWGSGTFDYPFYNSDHAIKLYATLGSNTAITLSQYSTSFWLSGSKLRFAYSFNDNQEVSGLRVTGADKDLVSVDTWPEGIIAIGNRAFADCYSLEYLELPDSVTMIDMNAFIGCSNLAKLKVPASVSFINDRAFNYENITTIVTDCTAYARTWATNNHLNVEVVHPEDHIITDPATDPTCTETGLTEGSHCDLCGDVLVAQEEIPATGHTLITIEGSPATCTEDGVTDTIFCDVCGENIQEEEIVPALGHVWTSHGANWAEDGSACHFHLICERCNEEANESAVISADAEESTTCSKNAWTAYTATLTLGEQTFTDTLRLQDVPALPHTIEILPAVSATCTETGLTEGQKCSVCGEILTAQETIPALGHVFTLDDIIWADDGSACTMHLLCDRCGEEVDAEAEITAEHDVNTSCAEKGWSTYNALAEWGEQFFTDIKRVQDVDPAPHTIEIIPGYEASCTESGLTEGRHCTVCNEMVVSQEIISPLGHDWNVEMADWGAGNATCKLYLICNRCGETMTADADVTADAEENFSCTDWAWTHYTAAYTDGAQTITETRDEMDIPPIPHVTETLPAVPATCTEDGLTEGEVCTVCGNTVVEQTTVPALGHDWRITASDWAEDASSCLLAIECGRCGETQSVQAVITAEAEENTSCTDWAWTVYTASFTVDGTVLTDTMRLQNVEPAPHTIVIIPAVEATDREPGCTEEQFCSVCGTVLLASEEIPALWSYTDDGLTVTAYNGTETNLVIPEGVTTLGKDIFKSNTSITSIRIPEGVTALGTQSFFQATNLHEVWLPDSLQGNTITAQTFYNVTAVFHANAGSPAAKVLSYRKFDFVDQNGWAMRYAIRTVSSEPTAIFIAGIPDTGETSLTIPADIGGVPVTELQSLAVANHAVLTEVHLPDTLATIAADTFDGCPDGLTIYSSASAPARTWAHENSYTWAHEAHQPEILAAVPATCTEDGLTEGSWCPECGEILTVQEIIPALGHDWSAINYTWAEDNSTVTASRICSHNAEHAETETVPAAGTVTKQPTCEEAGETTWTSEAFVNPSFAAQSKVVADIDPLGHDWDDITYTWAEDNRSVTASRVCNNDPEHVETETAIVTQLIVSPTETAEGSCEWIGSHFENDAFVQQTKSVTIPALNTLSVLRIPAGVRIIEEEAFEGLPAQAILIPDGCTSIGSKAFAGCSNLLYVRIPASVVSIAPDAFDRCPLAVIDRMN